MATETHEPGSHACLRSPALECSSMLFCIHSTAQWVSVVNVHCMFKKFLTSFSSPRGELGTKALDSNTCALCFATGGG